jgi:hypothetical protein
MNSKYAASADSRLKYAMIENIMPTGNLQLFFVATNDSLTMTSARSMLDDCAVAQGHRPPISC